MTNIPLTGLRRLSFYTATPVETCDHCSSAIKNVSVVSYRDGTQVKLGSKCIENLMKGNTSMLALYRKNIKLLKTYQEWVAILNLPVEEMPHADEYYNSGLYIVTDHNGKMITVEGRCIIFYPILDIEKSFNSRYGPSRIREGLTTPEANLAHFMPDLEKGKAWLVSEVARIEGYLARVAAKGFQTPA